jgi:hypothetical protein
MCPAVYLRIWAFTLLTGSGLITYRFWKKKKHTLLETVILFRTRIFEQFYIPKETSITKAMGLFFDSYQPWVIQNGPCRNNSDENSAFLR